MHDLSNCKNLIKVDYTVDSTLVGAVIFLTWSFFWGTTCLSHQGQDRITKEHRGCGFKAEPRQKLSQLFSIMLKGQC